MKSIDRDALESANVKRVRVRATVEFEAYASTLPGWQDRVGWELADAIEYRAPRLTDFEDEDGLVVMENEHGLTLRLDRVEVLGDADLEQVAELAEGYAGEVFG